MSVRILPEALAELSEAATWLEEQEAGLGLALLDEYRERLAFAVAMPGAGAIIGATRAEAKCADSRFIAFIGAQS